MPLGTATITGDLLDALGATLDHGEIVFTPGAGSGADVIVDGADAMLGFWTLSIRDLPDTVTLTEGPWRIHITPRNHKVQGVPIFTPQTIVHQFAAGSATTWGSLLAGNVSEPLTTTQYDLLDTRVTDNAAGLAGKVGKGELVLNALDYGTDGSAIAAAIADVAANGGKVLVPGPDRTWDAPAEIVIPRRVEVEVAAGATVQRAAAGSTAPVFRLNGNNAKLTGGGRVETLSSHPSGVVAVAPDTTGLVEWCLIAPELYVKGVKAAGNVGVRLSGGSTFQNEVRCTVDGADVGALCENNANANVVAPNMLNIATYAHRQASTLENRLGGVVLASPGVTVYKLEGSQFIVGEVIAEPGAGSIGYSIDAASYRTVIAGALNCSTVGTNSSTTTTEIGRGLVVAPVLRGLAAAGQWMIEAQATGKSFPSVRIMGNGAGAGQINLGRTGDAAPAATLRCSTVADRIISDAEFQAAGKFACNGATPQAKAADPGTATGTDAAVINAIVTALRNIGIVT